METHFGDTIRFLERHLNCLTNAPGSGGRVQVLGFLFALALVPCHASNDAYQRGMRLLADGELREARVELQNAVQESPERVDARVWLGDVLSRLGDLEPAMEQFKVARVLAPTSVLPLVMRSSAWARVGNDAAAWDDLEAAVDLNSRDSSLFCARARFWLDRRDTDAVMEETGRALAIDPEMGEALQLRGTAHLLRNEANLAVQYLERAVKALPANGRAYYNKGLAYKGTNDLTAAIADFNSAIAANYRPPQVFWERALALEAVGSSQDAISDLNQVLRRSPAYADAYARRASLKHRLRDDSGFLSDSLEAIMYHGSATAVLPRIDRVLQEHPNDHVVLALRGGVRLSSGQPQAAITDFDEVISLKPQLPGPYRFRAQALAALGHVSRAKADLDEALRLTKPDDSTVPVILSMRAQLMWASGDRKAATVDVIEALNHPHVDVRTAAWASVTGVSAPEQARTLLVREDGDWARALTLVTIVGRIDTPMVLRPEVGTLEKSRIEANCAFLCAALAENRGAHSDAAAMYETVVSDDCSSVFEKAISRMCRDRLRDD